jgi:ribonuclease J
MSNKKFRIIPLGGLGEVGKNMIAYEYGENILVVDTGIMFPENDMLGIETSVI